MSYFPLFFDLRAQKVLIVGGGEVALRKAALLMHSGARITLVAPEIHPELLARADQGAIELAHREFIPEDLTGARLVIVATSRRAINRWIATLSEARGIPVNVVDDREASRFIVPAIIDRDPRFGGDIHGRRIPRVGAAFARTAGGIDSRENRRVCTMVARIARTRASPARPGRAAAILRGAGRWSRGAALRRRRRRRRAKHQSIAQQLLARTQAAPRPAGDVTLVGAGPGDPELLTLKALRALQDADIVLHDRLVPAAILDLARRDASLISVGKAAGGIGSTQEEINALLIEHASSGKRVVRLKGGDPFIFGRGGEELEALAKARISFSVVPGITAAAGCAAYAGIPLTHRDHAHSVTFVAAHTGSDLKEPDWRALAMTGATAVFYMGLARLPHIAASLIAHGAAADLPAGIVAQGTLPEQRVITATLGTIAEAAARSNLESPALLVVGEVVSLHASLSWFNGAAQAGAGLEVPRSA